MLLQVEIGKVECSLPSSYLVGYIHTYRLLTGQKSTYRQSTRGILVPLLVRLANATGQHIRLWISSVQSGIENTCNLVIIIHMQSTYWRQNFSITLSNKVKSVIYKWSDQDVEVFDIYFLRIQFLLKFSNFNSCIFKLFKRFYFAGFIFCSDSATS